MKRRVEALERQHNLGAFSAATTPSLDTSNCTTPRSESLPPVIKSPLQMQDMSLPIKEGSISPPNHTIDLMDPALSSMASLCSSTSMDHDWMSQHSHFMGPSSSRTTPLHSPAISQSPEYFTTKFQSDDEKDQSRISSSMMTMSSLDDYISHNNSIIEDMCGPAAESISGDDIELSFQHMRQQRPVSAYLVFLPPNPMSFSSGRQRTVRVLTLINSATTKKNHESRTNTGTHDVTLGGYERIYPDCPYALGERHPVRLRSVHISRALFLYS